MDTLNTTGQMVTNPHNCADKHYTVTLTSSLTTFCNEILQVVNMSVFEESPSCDHLYFSKQVFFWGDYKVGDIAGRCHYSKPAQMMSNSWDQKAEKLARSSLMFR